MDADTITTFQDRVLFSLECNGIKLQSSRVKHNGQLIIGKNDQDWFSPHEFTTEWEIELRFSDKMRLVGCFGPTNYGVYSETGGFATESKKFNTGHYLWSPKRIIETLKQLQSSFPLLFNKQRLFIRN